MESITTEQSVQLDTQRRYLACRLNETRFGIDLEEVLEILSSVPITSVPHVPAYILGVMNLRGKIVPVMDLRLRFGLEPASVEQSTMVVVCQGEIQMGLIVDGVDDVCTVEGSLQDLVKDGEHSFTHGAALDGDVVTQILDIKAVLQR